jgi:hypothetical protein
MINISPFSDILSGLMREFQSASSNVRKLGPFYLYASVRQMGDPIFLSLLSQKMAGDDDWSKSLRA